MVLAIKQESFLGNKPIANNIQFISVDQKCYNVKGKRTETEDVTETNDLAC